MSIESSFRAGWRYGSEKGAELTSREAAERFNLTGRDADAFHQGSLDGIEDDRFRLELGRETLFDAA